MQRTDRSDTTQGPPAGGARRGRVLVPLAVAAAVVAVLGLAVWSMVWVTGEDRSAEPGTVALEDGVVRVDDVTSAAAPGMAMPGMGTDEDPVPEGMRRVSVDVTLQATEDEPLEFSVERFSLQVAGEDAVAPHRSVLPESVLPAGTQLSGTLVFEVPDDATTAELAYDGEGGTEVTLPPEEPGDGQHGQHSPGQGSPGQGSSGQGSSGQGSPGGHSPGQHGR